MVSAAAISAWISDIYCVSPNCPDPLPAVPRRKRPLSSNSSAEDRATEWLMSTENTPRALTGGRLRRTRQEPEERDPVRPSLRTLQISPPTSSSGFVSELQKALQQDNPGNAALNHDSGIELTGRSQSSVSASSTASTKRSRSPVKTIGDLYMASKTVVYSTFPESISPDFNSNYLRLREIADGIDIIPKCIEVRLQKLAGQREQIRPWMLRESPDSEDTTSLIDEFHRLTAIRDDAILCANEDVAEPAWNSDVHRPILHLALQRQKGVRVHNITTARPCTQFVPTHRSGDMLQSKLVDFSINLVPDESVRLAIVDILTKEPSQTQCINQALYNPIRFSPCAISIETKASASASDGRVQLGLWTAAFFSRLRSFRQRNRLSCLPVSQIWTPIMIPMIRVTGQYWTLSLAQETNQEITIFGDLDLGNTGSLISMYKLIAALRVLIEWADGTYREWFDGFLKSLV